MSPTFQRYQPFSAVAVCVALGASIAALSAQQQRFRSGIDVIAVDVQVVDGNGHPITGFDPEDFEVSIQGRRRRVASVDLLQFNQRTGNARKSQENPPVAMVTPTSDGATADGRVYLLAIDTMSFIPAATRPVTAAARTFVESLNSNDLVGLLPFPMDGVTDLTTDHAAVIAALDRVVGTRASTPGDCRLNPSDIIDFTSPRAGDGTMKPDPLIARRISEVAATAGPTCRPVQEARMLALMEESEIAQRLQSLRSALVALADHPQPKTIVLVSAGIISADRTGGRPDIGLDIGRMVGQEAARANATIYTLWVDQLRRDHASAATRGLPRTTDQYQRDAMLVSAPLDRITAATGGVMLNVMQGGGEFAFDRILRETSARYLLGVEPDEADRDGKPRTLTVRVKDLARGAAVRARSWVVVPPRSTPSASMGAAEPALAPSEPSGSAADPVPSGSSQPIAPVAAAPVTVGPSAPVDASLAPALARAGSYVQRFTNAFTNVIAEERYVQDVLPGGTLLAATSGGSRAQHRVLLSDWLLVRTADVVGWQAFRDVFEVDGAAVRDRRERLTRLFEQPASEALVQAARIAQESARYNIGAVERTVNMPVLTLLFLQPELQRRFTFERAAPTPGFAATVEVIAFRETARPTVIRTVQDTDRPSSGRLWLDGNTGAILQTELVLSGTGVSVRFTTLFRDDPTLSVAVPVRMQEEYSLPSGKLLGIATYDRFRRFTVNTETTVTPGSAGRP